MRVQVPCCAKINTFLSVGRVDAYGYHPLRTVFQSVGLFDELELEAEMGMPSAGWSLKVVGQDLPEENTLSKTLRFLNEVAQVPHLEITLRKAIPSQSGLGGGSSDAAGLIRGVQPFLPAPLSRETQLDIAAAVGADVPYFLVGGRAVGEGYGERLTLLPDLEPRWVLIAHPEIACSTKEMYGKLDDISYDWKELDIEATYNDFERVAPCECLELIERLQSLGATSSGLTGSGSAVFGFFDSLESGLGAKEQLGEGAWLVRTLSREESLGMQIVE